MKTELQRLNRAFRKETKRWLGMPNGFRSKKEWKRWCRNSALNMESVRRIEGVAPHEVISDQYDADYVVSEEMSCW